jgi:diamine N-acetyltransferase
MHLFSSAKKKHRLEFVPLSECHENKDKYIALVTHWFTSEWGYIHDKNKPDDEVIKNRKEHLEANAEKIYLAFLNKQPVGAFRLEYKKFDPELIASQQRKGLENKLKTSEIWFVYVDKHFRNLGFGSQMVKEIKRLSKDDMKAGLVLLETLKPGLNRLYENEKAKVLCENQLDCYPTDVLIIKLKSEGEEQLKSPSPYGGM